MAKNLYWPLSIFTITAIMMFGICLKHITDLRTIIKIKMLEIDKAKDKFENAETNFEKKRADFLRQYAKSDKGIKTAAQIWKESQFIVAITSASDKEKVMDQVISPNAGGFIVSINEKIYAITAKHVCFGIEVNKPIRGILIHFKPSTTGEILNSEPAELLGTCPDHDIAVLEIKNKDFNFPWTPGVLETKQNLQPGDKVFAIGSPLGNGFSITEGCLINLYPLTRHNNLIEFSAIINPGNSGGPILNNFGEIIGLISSLRINEVNNTGFALSSVVIAKDAEKIVKNETIEHSTIYTFFGNSWELNEFSKNWEKSPPKQKGVIVTEVIPGSEAAIKGLRKGDLILECSGIKPQNAGSIKEMIMLKEANSLIELLVRHESGVEEKITLKLFPLHE